MLIIKFLTVFTSSFSFDYSIVPEGNVDIENQLSMTVIFPDATLPQPTNGGFANQEEFRKFIASKNNGRWSTQFHSRPYADRLADYEDDTIADAFPLQFPFGFTGLPDDPVVKKMRGKNSKNRKHFSRERKTVILKYLTHRKATFHRPMFNLVMDNVLMKETIFLKTKIFCNVKCSDNSTMGAKYGSMSAASLEKAIQNVRNHLSVQHSNSAEHQYLKSIRAICGNLPHSNEATMEARQVYFALLMKFGLPCIFLTVSPDDLCNFRIVVYALNGKEQVSGRVNVTDLSDREVLADYKVRSNARLNHPGLCAEEYERIVHLIIKHLFNWDMENQKSNGVGLFAEILAFALATEEQGRKSLHGHFLLFVKGWKEILDCLQERKVNPHHGKGTHWKAKRFYENACSARLFSDFEPRMPLCKKPVFFHKCCRKKRKLSEIRFTVLPVSDQHLREMRHKKKCHEHKGKIATCEKCNTSFSVNEIVSNALNVHLGKPGKLYSFPEGNIKHLDKQVYEMQKDFSWMVKNDRSKAVRYFACNALVNMHLVTHATRCFKKGPECFANLPDCVSDSTKIVYNNEYDIWANWCGEKKKRYMFRFQPKRCIEDAFINTHSPEITSSLGCNSNVLVGMNGRSVIYVTGYNAKSQQKEERIAFEKVSEILIKVLKKQVRYFINIIIMILFTTQPAVLISF